MSKCPKLGDNDHDVNTNSYQGLGKPGNNPNGTWQWGHLDFRKTDQDPFGADTQKMAMVGGEMLNSTT